MNLQAHETDASAPLSRGLHPDSPRLQLLAPLQMFIGGAVIPFPLHSGAFHVMSMKLANMLRARTALTPTFLSPQMGDPKTTKIYNLFISASVLEPHYSTTLPAECGISHRPLAYRSTRKLRPISSHGWREPARKPSGP